MYLFDVMNSALENLNKWFKANKLSLYVSKRYYSQIPISVWKKVLQIGNEPLQKETTPKFLGVYCKFINVRGD